MALAGRHQASNILRTAGALPSVDTAKKIADAFEVTLDYLVDETASPAYDKKTVNRLKDIQLLAEQDKAHILATIDAFLRDAKTRTAYQ